MGIEIETDKITRECRYLNISCLCETCANRITCSSIREIKSFFRDRKSIKCIIDTEITIYSCNNYEREVPNICNNDNICVYCGEI